MNIFSIIPIEVFSDNRLSKTDLRVLGVILSWRNKSSNLCWPSRDLISERCGGLSKNKVSNATTHLAKLGWLKKMGSGGRSRPSQYEFIVPDLEPESEFQNGVANFNLETVPDLDKTVPDLDKTVPDSNTKRCLNQVGAKNIKEQTTEQTKEQTINARVVMRAGVEKTDLVKIASDIDPVRGVEKTDLDKIMPDIRSVLKKSPEKMLNEFGISGQLAKDFLEVRKAKKLPLTQTAMAGIHDESLKAGITIFEAITIATRRGWASFRANWDWDQNQTRPAPQYLPPDQRAGHDQQTRPAPQYLPPDQRQNSPVDGRVIESTAKRL